MGIFFGLMAALGWGTSDFLARHATREIGSLRTLLAMHFVGLLGLTAYAIVSGELMRVAQSAPPVAWAWGIAVGVCNLLSALALYRAFEIGVISVVSPVAASYAALTVLLAYASGESLTTVHGLGVAVTLAGVILAATHFIRSPDDSPSQPLMRGVGWAFLAALGWGVTFWLLGFKVTPSLGGIMPVWLARLTGVVCMGGLSFIKRSDFELPRGRIWWSLIGVGVLDTTAFVANALGLLTDQVSIVTVLASLFTAVTVVLAWVFLREPLSHKQWLGILVIFAGIVLVSI